jgi:lipopolysaccharide biosynthesis glycosyltransferase
MTVGHTASLPLEFNYFAKNLGNHEQFRTSRKKIIHFIGPQKPWHFSELEQFFYRRLNDFSKEFTMKVPEMERFDIQSHSNYWFIENQLLVILRSEKSDYASLILSARKSTDLKVLNWKARFKAKLLIISFRTLLKNRNF